MAVRILHIDTSGAVGLVMVAVDGKPISHQFSEGERDHAGKINMLVAEVLREAELSLDDMDAVAVCNGPGSYTGLRIGLATAKGYCYALDKQLILHNRLMLMLQELRSQEDDKETNLLALLPARAGEYYMAASGNYQSAPKHITAQKLLEEIAECHDALDIIGQYGSDLSQIQIKRHVAHGTLDISAWAKKGYEDFLEDQFADLAYAEPEYLKAAYIATPRVDR
jgi:tRNA threonylcarbamoyladenosine biosynthesis protein TsaB